LVRVLVSPKEGIEAVTSEVAAGSSADFTPCYLASDVILGAIGMQWDLRPLQDPQQLVFVGIESCQQAIQGDEAGASAKEAIEAKSQGAAAFCGGRNAIYFQIDIEAPDQSADMLLLNPPWRPDADLGAPYIIRGLIRMLQNLD
jgi:hypothetical protein